MRKSKLTDFDPEALLDPAPSSSDDENAQSSSEEDTKNGREHYQEVGKSKLRKKEVVPLGPAYDGSRITRDEMQSDDDSDEPFAKSFDIEDSEDESEEEAVNGNGVTHSEESKRGSDEDMGGDDEEDDDDSEEDEAEDGPEADQTAKLRELMQDTNLVTSALSNAAKADIDKGVAIKTQRRTFDSLLNSRIRLQKALIASNTMAIDTNTNASHPAVQAAEAAALGLLNNLTSLRSSLDETRTGQKRSFAHFSDSTPSEKIWSSIQGAESSALPHWKAILSKWSNKTRSASLSSGQGRLNDAGPQQTLTDVLDAQLRDPGRLIERTRMPRSCAPGQSAPSEKIYDDADFYGLLLKELLENRSNEANGAGEFVVQAPWQLMREAKTKKIVDTRASKGRKLRYTVHEKLQNFCAPENRNQWGDRQREELFGGLFGRRVGLGEEDDVKSDEEDMDAEEEGLMLFMN